MIYRFKLVIVLGILCLSVSGFAQQKTLTETTAISLPNQWSLRPAGTSLPLGDLPLSITLSPDKRYAVILHCGHGKHEIRTFDLITHKQINQVNIKNAWYGSAFTKDGKKLYVSAGADDAIVGFDFQNGVLSNKKIWKLQDDKATPKFLYPCGIAIDQKERYGYIAAQYGNCILKMDLQNPENPVIPVITFPDQHTYPYKIILDASDKTAYVSLWGGKAVAVIQLKASGQNEKMDSGLRRNDAAPGAVHGGVTLIPTDSHPNEMVLTKDGSRLYVACANSNGVNVIDTKSNKVVEKLYGALYPNMPAGSTPNGLALSADEKILYVANADNNNLAVFDISQKNNAKSLGFIPTGWYPTAVAVTPQKEIMVANGKGNNSMPNPDGPKPGTHNEKTTQYIGGLFLGSLSFIPQPDDMKLKEYTRQAYLCSPLRPDLLPVKAEKGNPIPSKVGESTPVKYVVYIIKENRTYDQIFGDMPQGNGDSTLCLFGENITPNIHKIAREFVLLDNFYADAEVSADGHEWSMGAYATDFVQKSWPPQYGGHDNKDRKLGFKSQGSDPVNDSDVGHIWNRAKEAGITYRNYGEWVNDGGPEGKGNSNDPVLAGHIDPYYTGWNLDVSDMERVKEFQREFTEFEKKGELPRLIVMALPNDHTFGTRKGKITPRAYEAQNDLALGTLLEILSSSKFWEEMAVFIVEDDAQNGSDHVDAHRTEALVAGPFVKRGYVDHHIYSTTSMVRTIELILGLQPMSQFDAAALPMYASFTNVPNNNPYKHEESRVSLTEMNGSDAPMQKQSSMLNFKSEDANPDILFNEVIWKSVRGANSEMPAPVCAAFVRPAPSANMQDND